MALDADFLRFCRQTIASVTATWNIDASKASATKPSLWPADFSTCTTDFERVCTLLALPDIRGFTFNASTADDDFRPGLKSSVRSHQFRNAGNDSWRQGHIADALYLYTKALFFAVHDEETSFAFANRSCVLARLGADSAVVEDIDWALKYHYPEDRRDRLLVRRAQALLHLNRVLEAREDFLQVQRSTAADTSKSHSNPMITAVEVGLKQCAHLLDNPTSTTPSQSHLRSPLCVFHPDPPPFTQEQQPLFKLTYSGLEKGWELVTTRAIQPGELILIDKPYARRLRRERLLTHCYWCFRRSLNLTACRGCSEVGFCSVRCEEAAWEPLWSSQRSATSSVGTPCHRFECGQIHRLCLDDYAGWKWVLQLPLRSKKPLDDSLETFRSRLRSYSLDDCVGGAGISWLSFACLAETDPHVLLSLVQITSCDENKAAANKTTLLAFSGQRVCPSAPLDHLTYASIGWLATNSNRRTLHDLWQRTVAAVFLTHCLAANGYPLDWSTNCLQLPSSSEILGNSLLPASWAAACILHHIQAIASNAHTFTAYITKAVPVDMKTSGEHPMDALDLCAMNPYEMGSCLYPVLSLINHSCDPNVILVYLANGLAALYALHFIGAHQPLYGNYGYHYATHQWTERQQALREQYHFECACRACFEIWPTLNDKEHIRCSQCAHRIAPDSSCHCSPATQRATLNTYNRLMQLFHEQSINISTAYSNHSFQRLPRQLLDHHIAHVCQMLGSNGLEGVLLRPAQPFDYLQELLKLLLSLRYGCCFMESETSHMISTSEVGTMSVS